MSAQVSRARIRPKTLRGCGGRLRGLRRSTGNSALDAKRRETLKALDKKAEAFAELARREPTARPMSASRPSAP